MTEREEIELLLSQPEIVEWLGLNRAEIAAWLEPHTSEDEDDGPPRAA